MPLLLSTAFAPTPAAESPDFRDLGYSTIYTRESWESLLSAVAALVVVTAADRAELRAGFDEAQADYAAFERDMANDGHDEFPW